jgi:hypothetical protein
MDGSNDDQQAILVDVRDDVAHGSYLHGEHYTFKSLSRATQFGMVS